jgi:two-component system, sensor histidine kinase
MLHLSDAETAALLDAAPDAMVVIDEHGQIVLANARVETLFGYSRNELVAKPIEMLLPERFRGQHVGHRDRYAGGPRVRPMGAGMALFAQRKDGSEFPVEISLSPFRTAHGLLVSSAIRDISERKAVEAELVRARKEAESANRAKSAFLAAASHDLRQPLQTLSLVNAALVRLTPAGTRAAESVALQEQAIRSMSELLNALLDISKLESGAIKPDVRDFSVQAIFERLRAQFQSHADAKGVALLLDDCYDVVHTDPTLLEQVLQNLVANAIRYTERGQVHLRCPESGDTVHIEVLDTGPGIPDSERERIFEEFYQIPQPSGQRREGLGLGLSIVRRVAALLGHSLEIDSAPGGGSRFKIVVPKGKSDPSASAVATTRVEAQPGAGVVLVIDDEPAVADATAMLLEVFGYRTLLASGITEALERVRTSVQAPDVMISDFHLGAETGEGAIEAVRQAIGRTIPAVLITGDTSTAGATLADGIAACELLSKPVDSDRLLEVLARLV